MGAVFDEAAWGRVAGPSGSVWSACMARRMVLEVFLLFGCGLSAGAATFTVENRFGPISRTRGATCRARALFCQNTRDRPGSLG